VHETVGLAHPASWVDASEVADYLGIDREWVYRHALELDGRKLGSGPKAPGASSSPSSTPRFRR